MFESDCVINPESSLKAYFHDALARATEQNELKAEEHTLWYLTNLLNTYSRSEQFFDYLPDRGTLTPLAEYYQRAVEAESTHERRMHLQRLGDVAMFISGMFAPALKRRPVGVAYYMSMGESAYSTLADTASNTSREQTQAEIFSDLASRFTSFVNVLSSIRPHTSGGTGQDQIADNLLIKIDEWQRTGDPTLACELRESGIVLSTEEVTH